MSLMSAVWGVFALIFGLLAVLLGSSLYLESFPTEIQQVPNMNELEAIAKNTVKSPVSGDVVTMESLWAKQPCVITFFRRFGCTFCRLAAKELSGIKPQLDANNVRLIGIGVEELGVEDFMQRNFFDGELYIDDQKKCYKDLNYKRYGMLSILPAMLVKTSRDAFSRANADSLGGDLKGDYYQVGGTLVVSAGGEKLLLSHKQVSLADHVEPNEILKSLGITINPTPADSIEASQ